MTAQKGGLYPTPDTPVSTRRDLSLGINVVSWSGLLFNIGKMPAVKIFINGARNIVSEDSICLLTKMPQDVFSVRQ